MAQEVLRKRLEQHETEYLQRKAEFLSDGVITSDEQAQLDVIESIIDVIKRALDDSPQSVAHDGGGNNPQVDEQRDWNPSEDLAEGRSGDEVFQEDYMDSVMESTPKGADSLDLNEAMENLLRSPDGPNATSYLQIVSTETGMSLSQTQSQFKKFQALQQQQRNTSQQTGYPLPESIDEESHGSYMGSTASLRYGKMVGDHFGINPVFGAMLNPTGGIVGPSNTQLYDGDPDDPIVKHGIAHDAAGYLLNYHGDGPGYDYLRQEGRDTTNEYVGQQSGINYWLDKDDKHDLESEVIRKGVDAWGWGLDRVEEVKSAYEEVSEQAATAYNWAEEQLEEASDWVDETQEEAEQRVAEIWNGLVDNAEALREQGEELADDARETVSNGVEAVEKAAGQVAGWSSDQVDDAEEWISETASDVRETISESVETTWETANDAYDYADEKLANANEFIANLW